VPIIVSVDHDRREVRAVAVGPISYEDVKNHVMQERYFGGLAYPELFDARGAGISWTPREIREIVALLRRLGQESRLGPTAVLVSSDVAFGIMRMIEALLEDLCEVKPFWNEGEAKEWLASRPPPLPGT
jgi:hypothetical protein